MIRIETSPENWEKEAITMLSQDFYLCSRENKIYWENDNDN